MAIQVIKPAQPDGTTGNKPLRVKIKSTVDLKADNMVANYTQMRKAQKLIKTWEDDRKFLAEYMDKLAGPDDEAIITADGGSVRFSKRSMEQNVVKFKKLHEKLGDEVFYQILKISPEDLKRYMSGQDMEEFLKTEQTGPRRVFVTLNSPTV